MTVCPMNAVWAAESAPVWTRNENFACASVRATTTVGPTTIVPGRGQAARNAFPKKMSPIPTSSGASVLPNAESIRGAESSRRVEINPGLGVCRWSEANADLRAKTGVFVHAFGHCLATRSDG